MSSCLTQALCGVLKPYLAADDDEVVREGSIGTRAYLVECGEILVTSRVATSNAREGGSRL